MEEYMRFRSLSRYLDWANLDFIERKIVVAVCFDSSPESARKNLKLSRQQFYRHWGYLEALYHTLPGVVIEKLRSYGKMHNPLRHKTA